MENFVISWNSYTEVFHQTLSQLLSSHEFTDCLLVCEGGQLKCHKFVLSACSPWFREVLISIDHPNPVIILQDVKYRELKALLEFVYTGNVTVCENELHRMIEVGKSLKVTGLVAPDKQFGDTSQTPDKPVIESVVGMFKGVESLSPEQYLRADSGGETSRIDDSLSTPSISESKSFIEDREQSYFVGHNAEFDDDEDDDSAKVESQKVKGEGSIRGRRSFIESRPEDLADILQSIKNGTSCNWLSKKYGISVATIRKYAIAHGAPKGSFEYVPVDGSSREEMWFQSSGSEQQLGKQSSKEKGIRDAIALDSEMRDLCCSTHDELMIEQTVKFEVATESESEGLNAADANDVPQDVEKDRREKACEKKSRKRVRREDEWIRNKRKAALNSGKTYEDPKSKRTFGKERHLKPRKCSPACPYSCRTITEDQRLAVFDNFWKLSREKKTIFYLSSTKCLPKKSNRNVESRRKNSLQYFFNLEGQDLRVCKEFYLSTLHVGESRIYHAHKTKKLVEPSSSQT